MATIEWSNAAEFDLFRIWACIMKNSRAEVADAITESIIDSGNLLAKFPDMGELQVGYRRPVRRVVSGPYNIFYSHQGDKVVIERVLHGRQRSEYYL